MKISNIGSRFIRTVFLSRESIFSSIWRYFGGVFNGFKSVFTSSMTVVPYLFGIGDSRKEVTEQYPDPVSSRTEDDLPTNTRGLLFNDINKCTGCLACAEICPVNCIQIEAEPGSDASKKWVTKFDIDLGSCFFCGRCVEVCEPASLVHTKKYEGSVFVLSDLIRSFGRGPVTQDQRDRWELKRQTEEMEQDAGF